MIKEIIVNEKIVENTVFPIFEMLNSWNKTIIIDRANNDK
tara:strand:+ start:1007 stop:1126 length:120 start_codon:yes stop_codon:yes gene_type:complete